jgi:hypothetical protein
VTVTGLDGVGDCVGRLVRRNLVYAESLDGDRVAVGHSQWFQHDALL